MQTLAQTEKNGSWLTWFLRGVLVLGFLILVARLFELQIIKGDYYRNLSEGNRIKRVKINAPRGKILSRGGEALEGFDFAHITGYLSEVSREELSKIDSNCVEKGPKKLGQIVGRGGLGEYYNCVLSGVDGEELWEVDSLGNNIRNLGKKEPISGKDLKTNIDYNLQKQVAKAMQGKIGSVVATDKNGEVLAFYSSPSYNPKEIASALKNPNLPLFNRVIGGVYHPGSIFKPLVSIAALESGKIDKDFKFVDEGVLKVVTLYGDFSYSNWYFTQYGRTEGEVDLIKALARSTDTFFYKIGEMVGIDSLVEWSKKFGLTSLTEIDMNGEVLSLVPSPDWKERVKKEKWFLGNTYHFSIGQGDLALTPIAIHRANLAVANGGKLCTIKIADVTKCVDLKLKADNIKLVKEGMKKACQAGGTGYTFFSWEEKNNGQSVGCKTGTAETNQDGKTHAWFTVFAPLDNPEIILTVMVEKSGEGSKVAGPIAREIFDSYFNK